MVPLEKDEHVIHASQPHWWVLFSHGIATLFLFLGPVVLLYGLGLLFAREQPALLAEAMALATFAVSLWALTLWMYFFSIWSNYYLDMYYLTERRIIHVEQRGFFRREVASFRFDRVQDVTVHISGLIQTHFNFGNVSITTASAQEPFIMQNIPEPGKVKHIILRQVERAHGE